MMRLDGRALALLCDDISLGRELLHEQHVHQVDLVCRYYR